MTKKVATKRKTTKTAQEKVEAAILVHLKAIYKLSKAYGTKCYTSCNFIDSDDDSRGVVFSCNNAYYNVDMDHPIDLYTCEHMPEENKYVAPVALYTEAKDEADTEVTHNG